jgi:tetratricopeptide (TPR) repeat protein
LNEDGPRVILDEAWHALHTACRRGPFAFCDYDFLVNPDHFPLFPIPRSSAARLQRRWRDLQKFSLVCFKPDFEEREKLDDTILTHFKRSNLVADDRYYFVIKPNMSVKKAEQWAAKQLSQLKEKYGEGYSLSAGVSSYPFRDYPRAQVTRNCQKALLHGSFFGPGSVIVFDSLSLNVSGDAYFGEGDLSTAIREYRCGLDLDPEDVNLLNSLGVTYALMNRTTDALDAFNRALSHSSHNFMALYNRGLCEQAQGRYRAAIRTLTRARELCNRSDPEEAGSLNELDYQLGVSFFQGGQFRKCIDQLVNWYRKQADKKIAGKCCRFIGVSYYRIRKNGEASKWLQRSLSYDEFNAEALSLLGELYLTEKQGDEIALRLCEKSVELDSNNFPALLRLARALAACGDNVSAEQCLLRCTANKQTQHEAWYDLASIYLHNGEREEAKRYASKLGRARQVPPRLRKKAQMILAKISKKRT